MNDSKFVLTFQLRQHTPLIHFQHDQAGATLRATEVKSKLDRFIRERLQSVAPEVFEKHKDFIIANFFSTDKNPPPSSYKIHVVGTIEQKYLLANRFQGNQKELLESRSGEFSYLEGVPFFAEEKAINDLFTFDRTEELDSGKKKKIFSFNEEKLTSIEKWGVSFKPNLRNEPPVFYLRVVARNQAIFEIIEIAVPYTFAFENFGTRQSKGFGSFSAEKGSSGTVSEAEYLEMLKKQYKFVYEKQVSGSFPDILSTIQRDYKVLKSGRSDKEGGRYVKSKLFLYGVSLAAPIRWEKRKIKQGINSGPLTHVPYKNSVGTVELDFQRQPAYEDSNSGNWADSPSNFDYRFIRAILGLAEQFEFKAKYQTSGSDQPKETKYVVQVKSQGDIQRFRSPITFKVFGNKIYLCGNDIPQEMLSMAGKEKWFDFNLQTKLNGKIVTGHSKLLQPLMTPEKFNLEAFVDFALKNANDERIQGYVPRKTTTIKKVLS